MGDMNNSTFQYNILETSPTSTIICFLTYTSSGAQPGSNCGPPPTLAAVTSDSVFDDECMSTSQIGGSTLSMAANSTLLVMMMILSLIIV